MTVYDHYQIQKNKHSKTVVLFQMGDYFEAYNDDAERVASHLNKDCRTRSFGRGMQPVLMVALQRHEIEILKKRVSKLAVYQTITAPKIQGVVPREYCGKLSK